MTMVNEINNQTEEKSPDQTANPEQREGSETWQEAVETILDDMQKMLGADTPPQEVLKIYTEAVNGVVSVPEDIQKELEELKKKFEATGQVKPEQVTDFITLLRGHLEGTTTPENTPNTTTESTSEQNEPSPAMQKVFTIIKQAKQQAPGANDVDAAKKLINRIDEFLKNDKFGLTEEEENKLEYQMGKFSINLDNNKDTGYSLGTAIGYLVRGLKEKPASPRRQVENNTETGEYAKLKQQALDIFERLKKEQGWGPNADNNPKWFMSLQSIANGINANETILQEAITKGTEILNPEPQINLADLKIEAARLYNIITNKLVLDKGFADNKLKDQDWYQTLVRHDNGVSVNAEKLREAINKSTEFILHIADMEEKKEETPSLESTSEPTTQNKVPISTNQQSMSEQPTTLKTGELKPQEQHTEPTPNESQQKAETPDSFEEITDIYDFIDRTTGQFKAAEEKLESYSAYNLTDIKNRLATIQAQLENNDLGDFDKDANNFFGLVKDKNLVNQTITGNWRRIANNSIENKTFLKEQIEIWVLSLMTTCSRLLATQTEHQTPNVPKQTRTENKAGSENLEEAQKPEKERIPSAEALYKETENLRTNLSAFVFKVVNGGNKEGQEVLDAEEGLLNTLQKFQEEWTSLTKTFTENYPNNKVIGLELEAIKKLFSLLDKEEQEQPEADREQNPEQLISGVTTWEGLFNALEQLAILPDSQISDYEVKELIQRVRQGKFDGRLDDSGAPIDPITHVPEIYGIKDKVRELLELPQSVERVGNENAVTLSENTETTAPQPEETASETPEEKKSKDLWGKIRNFFGYDKDKMDDERERAVQKEQEKLSAWEKENPEARQAIEKIRENPNLEQARLAYARVKHLYQKANRGGFFGVVKGIVRRKTFGMNERSQKERAKIAELQRDMLEKRETYQTLLQQAYTEELNVRKKYEQDQASANYAAINQYVVNERTKELERARIESGKWKLYNRLVEKYKNLKWWQKRLAMSALVSVGIVGAAGLLAGGASVAGLAGVSSAALTKAASVVSGQALVSKVLFSLGGGAASEAAAQIAGGPDTLARDIQTAGHDIVFDPETGNLKAELQGDDVMDKFADISASYEKSIDAVRANDKTKSRSRTIARLLVGGGTLATGLAMNWDDISEAFSGKDTLDASDMAGNLEEVIKNDEAVPTPSETKAVTALEEKPPLKTLSPVQPEVDLTSSIQNTTPDHIIPDAGNWTVYEGDGISQVIKRGLEGGTVTMNGVSINIKGDPALYEKAFQAAKNAGFTGTKGSPEFYKFIVENTGYMDANGNEIRLDASMIGKGSYEFQTTGKPDQPFLIVETNLAGSETHAFGDAFEGKNLDKGEYAYPGEGSDASNTTDATPPTPDTEPDDTPLEKNDIPTIDLTPEPAPTPEEVIPTSAQETAVSQSAEDVAESVGSAIGEIEGKQIAFPTGDEADFNKLANAFREQNVEDSLTAVFEQNEKQATKELSRVLRGKDIDISGGREAGYRLRGTEYTNAIDALRSTTLPDDQFILEHLASVYAPNNTTSPEVLAQTLKTAFQREGIQIALTPDQAAVVKNLFDGYGDTIKQFNLHKLVRQSGERATFGDLWEMIIEVRALQESLK